MFKKIITIVLPIIAVTAAIFVFGLKVYQDSFDKFQYDGYVIGASTGKESAKYHFAKDEKYKVNKSNNEVEFTNSEDKEVVIPDASFVHYTDGSISTFKKAVVLNMENVKTDSLQYYNIFKGSVFTKTNEGYQIQYLENKLTFNNFIVKISDTKYMIVGKNLEIKYGDKKETIKDGFLEINYLDGNIIRIENQDFLLQNISSDFNINVEGIDLDLLNKKIIYEEETKVNLGEITIDSDDNIEIIPDENNTVIDPEEMNKIEELENAPVVTPGSNVDGMESGVVDTTIEKADEIIQENEKIPDAIFKTVLFNVSPSTMNATVSVDDPANTLKGEMTWKIIENASNSIMCQNRAAQGKKSIEVECSNLTPEANYSLIVSSKYEKNEVTYEKDFLQRTFITTSAGVSIIKDYVSTNMVAFRVQIPDTSDLSSFTYKVIESADPNNPIETGHFVRTHSSTSSCDNQTASVNAMIPKVNECEVMINTGIKPNTKYSLIVNEIVHGTLEMPENFEVYKSATSLKQKPSFGGTNIVTNKMSSKFSLSLNTVTDPNNSILSYRADIYPYNTQDDPTTIVATREASIANQIDINVDGETLVRGNNYVAKVYVTYYDNEKEYDVLVGTSPVMNMTSVEAPTVRFEEIDILHDTIRGNIVITDVSNAIVEGTIKIKIQNMSEAKEDIIMASYEETSIDRTTTKYTIEKDGLQANTDYRFVIQAQVVLEKNLNEPSYANIGEFLIKTPKPAVQKAWIEDNTREEVGHYFAVQYLITPDDCREDGDKKVDCYIKDKDTGKIVANPAVSPERINKAWHEIKTIQTVRFRLRKKDDTFIKTTEQCEAAEYCWEFEFTDKRDAYDESDIIDMFYPSTYASGASNAIPTFRPLSDTNTGSMALDLNLGDATEEGGGLPKDRYVLEMLSAKDYTNYANDIDMTDYSVEFMSNGQAEQDIVTFTENLVKDEEGKPIEYSITTKQIITEFTALKDTGAPYEMEEWYEHYLVNLNTNKVCDLGKKEPGKNPTTTFLINNGKDVSFNIDTYNSKVSDDCKIVRGDSYGYYYEYKLKVVSEGATYNYQHGAERIFRPFKDEHQPLMDKPDLQAYISNTISSTDAEGDDIKYVFKYDINDPTRALGSFPQFKYKGDSDEDWKNVYCGADYTLTENCVAVEEDGTGSGTIAIGSFSGSKVSLKTDYDLLKGAKGSIELNNINGTLEEYEYEVKNQTYSRPIVNEMVIEPEKIFSSSNKVYWTVAESKDVQNAITYTFPKTDPDGHAMNIQYAYFTKYFVGAKLTLKNACAVAGCEQKQVVLYRMFDDNGYQNQNIDGPAPQITIMYGEITALMSETDVIETDVELLYDMNHYGFDTSDSDAVTFQSYRTAYTFEKMESISGIFRDTSLTCKMDDPKCTLSFRSSDHTNEYYENQTEPAKKYDKFVLTKENGSMYYEPTAGQKKYLQAKKLNTLDGSCGKNCTFRFTSIIPTLYMNDADVKGTYGGVNYTMSFAIANDLLKEEKEFQIRIHYYEDANMTTRIKHKGNNYIRTISYNDLENTYKLEGTDKYVITESELLQDTTYYARVMWKIKNVEEKDFYYDATWHLKNKGKKTRLYKFKTKITADFSKGHSARYEYGTQPKYKKDGENIIDNRYYKNDQSSEYYTNIHPDYSRVLHLYTTLGLDANRVLDGIDIALKLDLDENGTYETVWYEKSIGRSDLTITGSNYKLHNAVSLEPKEINGNMVHFKAGAKFEVSATPWHSCNPEDDPGNTTYQCGNVTPGKRTYNAFTNVLSYSISAPSISIIRIANGPGSTDSDVFRYQITFSDTHRAVGKYNYKDPGNSLEIEEPAKYTIKIMADGEEVTDLTQEIEVTTPTYTHTMNTDVTACRGATTCSVNVSYKMDLSNAGTEKIEVTTSKNINTKYYYDAGVMSQGSITARKIEVLFRNNFRAYDVIKKYDCVISHSTYPDLTYNDLVPTFKQKTGSGVWYTTIDLQNSDRLKVDELYSITVQFKASDGVLLDEWTSESIIYSSS